MLRLGSMMLILAAGTYALFSQALNNEFTGWDDAETIVHNPRMNPPNSETLRYYWTHPESGLYVPLTYTYWSALASIKLNPRTFHAASLVIHILNVLLVFSILRQLGGPDLPAFLGAAFFAIHPLQVETVGWASGAKDLLAGMFSLLMIDQYLRRTGSGYAIAILAMILGVLSKPIAVVAPAIAAILSIGMLRRPARDTLRSLSPMFAIAIACIIWARIVQSAFDATRTPLWTRPLIALDALSFYLCKLVVPTNLGVIYGRTPSAVVESGVIAWAWILPAIVAIILWQLRRCRWLVCAGLVLLVGILPVSGLTRFMFQIHSTVADHYMYLPMLGAAMAVTWITARNNAPLPVAIITAAGLCLFAILSLTQLGHWRNSIALFERAIQITPGSATAHSNLGVAYAGAGQLDRAVREFEAAVKISGGQNRLAHTNLAQAYLLHQDYERAAYHANMALELARRDPPELRGNTAWEQSLLEAATRRLQSTTSPHTP